jgi:enamine deaminase RidA (YjgF/YER057c/UK114 family)
MNGAFRVRTTGDAPEDRLAALGLTLPALRPAAGSYRGYVQAGDLLFLAGQGADGWTGQVGTDLPVDRARLAARDCMLNLLAQTRDALGALDRVRQVVKVLGFVACTPQFRDTPAVLDGASDLLIAVFGEERGTHARIALYQADLPREAPLTAELTLLLRRDDR